MSDTVATEETNAADTNTPTSNGQAVMNGKEFTFFFKTEKLTDAEGNEIGKGKKHPDVKAILPIPSKEDVINKIAEGGKVADLIMEAIQDVVYLAARQQINDKKDEAKEKSQEFKFSATDFDINKLSLDFIATMPKGQRGAWAPGEDEFKDFSEAYKHVLVHVVDYDPKKTQVHLDHFKNGLTKVKTNKPVLAKLLEFLTLFGSRVEPEVLEENKQTYEYYVNKATKYLNAEEKNLLEAL